MAPSQRIELACCLAVSSLLILTCATGFVSAVFVVSGPHLGFASSESNITIGQNGRLGYDAYGTRFSILIVTIDNFDRFESNESFAYIAEFSVLNVTSASVDHEIAPGVYAMLLFFDEAPGSVTFWGANVSYASATTNGVPFPWDIVIVTVFTAFAASLVTYAILKRKTD